MSNCSHVLSYVTLFNGFHRNIFCIFAVGNNGKNDLLLSHKLRLTINIKNQSSLWWRNMTPTWVNLRNGSVFHTPTPSATGERKRRNGGNKEGACDTQACPSGAAHTRGKRKQSQRPLAPQDLSSGLWQWLWVTGRDRTRTPVLDPQHRGHGYRVWKASTFPSFHSHTHTHLYTPTHTYTHLHTHTHTYTHTHPHTQKNKLSISRSLSLTQTHTPRRHTKPLFAL